MNNEVYMEMQKVRKKQSVRKGDKMQQTNDTTRRSRIRLSEIERMIKKERILIQPPSRSKLLEMCEDGTFETAGNRPSRFGWLVYEDSFWRWVKTLDGESTGLK